MTFYGKENESLEIDDRGLQRDKLNLILKEKSKFTKIVEQFIKEYGADWVEENLDMIEEEFRKPRH